MAYAEWAAVFAGCSLFIAAFPVQTDGACLATCDRIATGRQLRSRVARRSIESAFCLQVHSRTDFISIYQCTKSILNLTGTAPGAPPAAGR